MALIAWYPLNGDIKDYSGNAYNLTNNGATNNASGKIGSCYEFDKTLSANMTCENLKCSNMQNEFTVSAWFKSTQTHEYATIVSLGNSAITIDCQNGTNIRAFIYLKATGSPIVLNSPCLKDKWTHVTYKLENEYLYLYVNGVLKSKIAAKGVPRINNSDNVYLGIRAYDSSYYFQGCLNDVRIYNEALSAKQIKEIAQAKICHYTFNEELYENTTNLYDNKNKLSIVNAVVEWENTHALKCEIAANTKYAGLNFNSNLTLEPLTTYTLSYKFKKVAGKLLQIRGHVEQTNFEILHTTINGKEFSNYSYYTGIDLTDSFDTYEIVIVFNTKEDITSLNKMYVQPNAMKDEYVKVRVWDIQVEKKDHATPFTPNSRSQVLKDISGYGYDMTTYNQYSPVWNKDDSSNRIKNYSTLTKKDSYSNLNFKYKYPDAFTFSCWVRTTDSYSFCLIGFPHGNNTAISLAINSGGKISLHSYYSTPDANADKWYANSNTSINDGEWHLATITYDGTTVKSYIDGKYETSSIVTFDFERQAIYHLAINMRDPDSNWNDYETRRYEGDISDVRVYATALSAEDIKLLYQPEINIDKTNVIRCSEINEERIENKKGFNKDASITYNEFNEIPNIESGVYNLKLGNEILPVLIDMDNDEGRWARVFYHNCKSGTVLFSSANSYAEAKETNTNIPTSSDKYSILSKLESFRPNTNSPFEFRIKYPTDTDNGLNKWTMKHYSNITLASAETYPLLSDIEGLTPTSETIVEDTNNFIPSLVGDYYIRHYKTKVYSSIAKNINFQIKSDDGVTCYVNNNIAFQKKTSVFNDVKISLNKGWNTLEFLYYENAGQDYLTLNQKISELVDILDYNGTYNDSNIWKQTSNPTYEKVTGYTPVKINWTSNFWGGLEWTNGSTTLIDGSVNHGNWFYAIGVSTKHVDGMPSSADIMKNASTPNDVELWVRINNYDLFADNLIENVSISRNGVLTAKEFREIY